MAPAEVQLPNGMAWREGSSVVYFVDSGEESISEYATDEQVGAGSHGQVGAGSRERGAGSHERGGCWLA